MNYTDADRRHMARALKLAALGLYTTTPNPRVGCVLVNGDAVVGEGWHERAGGPHAEARALEEAGELARGATAYVSLEPCAHTGRTPPCSDALIGAGVARVVAAMEDPNPVVAGGGLKKLAAAGVQVSCGLMEDEARELNIGFVSRMTRARPWIRLKVAASLDGKTALLNGRSQWITGPDARRDGHHWRARACAVLTGIGTVRDDDPQLNVREVTTDRQPLRVVVDSRLEISPAARIVGPGTLIAAAIDDGEKAAALRANGAEVVLLPNTAGKVDLGKLFAELAKRGANEVHVEAGHKLNGSLMREQLVDELLVYLAPRIIGDTARGMFHLPELADLNGSRNFRVHDVAQIGEDIRIMARQAER